ncbi:MAG: hypothetical protein AAF639_16770 [Chloroflexota bacterium]
MAKNKTSNKTEREHRLYQVQDFYLKGWTQLRIASKLGVTQQQISYDLKAIQDRWRTETTINLDEVKGRELARLDLLWRTHWDAWEDSKRDLTKTRQEQGLDGAGKASILQEERSGDVRFLKEARECIKMRMELLGLKPTDKTLIQIRLDAEINYVLDRIEARFGHDEVLYERILDTILNEDEDEDNIIEGEAITLLS